MVGNKGKQHKGRGGKNLKCNEREMTEGMKGQEWKKGRKKEWRKREEDGKKTERKFNEKEGETRGEE